MKKLIAALMLVVALGAAAPASAGVPDRRDCVRWAQRHFDMTRAEALYFCARVR
jgi:hypothetical protein